MLWKGNIRFVGGFATTCIILLGLSAILGWDVCQQYVEFARHAADYIHTGGYDLTRSHSWNGFWTLLLSGAPTWLVRTATMLSLALTGVAIGALLRGPLEPRSDRFPWQFAGLIFASLLVSPHLYTYDLALLLWPLAAFMSPTMLRREQAQENQWEVYLLAAALFLLPALAPAMASWTHVAVVPVALFVGLFIVVRQTTPAAVRHVS
jgi:hypothetical protein